MDRGAWQAIVQRVSELDMTEHTRTTPYFKITDPKIGRLSQTIRCAQSNHKSP